MATKRKAAEAEVPSTVTLNSGFEMPLIGLGTWKCAPGIVGEAVRTAIESGYRHIDCAHCYNNEKEIGAVLASVLSADDTSDVICTRDSLFVTSKLWNTKHREDQVVGALKHSLAQLQLDYLDLYLIHWPTAFKSTEGHDENFPRRADGTGPEYDFELHWLETWRGMEAAQRLGLVRSIGVSNFNSKQLAELVAAAKIPPAINQVECHPLLPQRPLLEFCKSKGIVLTAYSPLGSPDAVARKPDDPSLLSDERIRDIGKAYGKSTAQVSLVQTLRCSRVVQMSFSAPPCSPATLQPCNTATRVLQPCNTATREHPATHATRQPVPPLHLCHPCTLRCSCAFRRSAGWSPYQRARRQKYSHARGQTRLKPSPLKPNHRP